MSETKFTPGPWDVEEDDERYGTYRLLNFGHGHNFNPDRMEKEHEANRDLLAAAPAMYAALEGLCAAFESRMGDEENATWHDEYNTARAALKKARGEA